MAMLSRENARQEVDEFISLNDPGEIFKNPQQLQFIRTLIDVLRRVVANVVRWDRAAPQVILSAPDGGAWIVTVANDGTLTTRNARA